MKIISTKSFVFRVAGHQPFRVAANPKPQNVPSFIAEDPLYHLAVGDESILEISSGRVPNLNQGDLDEQAKLDKDAKEQKAKDVTHVEGQQKRVADAVAKAKAAADADGAPVGSSDLPTSGEGTGPASGPSTSDAVAKAKAAAQAAVDQAGFAKTPPAPSGLSDENGNVV
jgi:hypothetical protein